MPIANTQFYVVDAHLQPVPIGVPGELCIGGHGLASGYWRRPELTLEKYVPNPFVDGPDARIYKTGDLVRRHADGMLEFLGRADHQVKIRGHRIELGEVEALLAPHPHVRECVAAARPDVSGENRLVAYVVSETSTPGKADDLRRYFHGRLPDYMVPSAFVFLDGLPRTPNGKVNRRALPSPEETLARDDAGCVGPSTSVEVALAGIWRKVLGRKSVGVEDNFFDLGGHSLMATRVIARIRSTFLVEIPMRTFFEMPTISSIAAAIQKALMRGTKEHGTEKTGMSAE